MTQNYSMVVDLAEFGLYTLLEIRKRRILVDTSSNDHTDTTADVATTRLFPDNAIAHLYGLYPESTRVAFGSGSAEMSDQYYIDRH